MIGEAIYFEGIVAPRRRRVERAAPSPGKPTIAGGAETHAAFFDALAMQVGLPLRHYRSAALTRRVPACLRLLRLKNVDDALDAIEARPELAPALLDVVLLGVTEFFRDAQVFDHLREIVLPELLATGKSPRIWSAACSNGQELYSLAMLLDDAGALEGSKLVGTDCRGRAVSEARAGHFANDTVLRLPEGWRRRYFDDERGGVRVKTPLRAAVEWKVADLLAGPETGPWDLVLWRNMAIYLESAAADSVWRRLVEELAPGGYVVAGKADHPGADVPLQRVAPCIYQKIRRR